MYYCCDCHSTFKDPVLWGENESEVLGCDNRLCRSDDIVKLEEEDVEQEEE